MSQEVTEVELVEASSVAADTSSQDGAKVDPVARGPVSADAEQSSSSDQRSPGQVDDERPVTIEEALPVGSYVDIISPYSGRTQIAKVLAVTPSSDSGSDFSYILEHGMLRQPMNGIDASFVKAYKPYREGAEAYCHINRDMPVDCTVGEFREPDVPDGMGLYTVKFEEVDAIIPFTNVQMKLEVKR